MALNVKNIPGGGKKFVQQDNIEPGTYPARVVQIIDLGLQSQRPYQGKDKPPAQELMVTYELVDEFMKDEQGNVQEDKPRWIHETFPLRSLENDKARSSERYRAFDPDGTKFDGDFTLIIGQPCNVTVVNNKSGDKIYDNVANVTAMRIRDAQNCPELKNPPKVFDSENPDAEVFKALPEWIRKKIEANLNFKGSKLEAISATIPKKDAGVKEEQVEKAPAGQEQDNNPY